MGSPVPKNDVFVKTTKELESTCKELALQYDLNPSSTLYLLHDAPGQVTIVPPTDGPIILRDNNSQVVASVETRKHYDHQQRSLVIDRVIMHIYETSCDQRKREDITASFFDRYPPRNDFNLNQLENSNRGLEGEVYIVKELKL